VKNKAFGIQIKPVTAKTSFGIYSPSERMKASFWGFQKARQGEKRLRKLMRPDYDETGLFQVDTVNP